MADKEMCIIVTQEQVHGCFYMDRDCSPKLIRITRLRASPRHVGEVSDILESETIEKYLDWYIMDAVFREKSSYL